MPKRPNAEKMMKRFDDAIEAIKAGGEGGPLGIPAPVGYIVERKDGKRFVKEGASGPRTDTNAATMYRKRDVAESRGKKACGRNWEEYRIKPLYF